jgi:hypothetical protein
MLGALMLISVVSINLARAMGRGQPFSRIVQQIHLVDCEQPCIMGLTIGKTTEQKAKEIFAELPKLSDNIKFSDLEFYGSSVTMTLTNIENGKDADFMGHFKNNLSYYGGIKLFEFYELPTLGELVTIYGIPTCAGKILPDDSYMKFYIRHPQSATFIVLPVLFDGVDWK